MPAEVIGFVSLAATIVFILSGVPVAFALFTGAVLAHFWSQGIVMTFNAVPLYFYDKASLYTLAVIPLFLLMGYFAAEGGFAEDAFKAGLKWMGHLKGSLAQSVLVAGTIFGAATGTGFATAAALTKIALPSMRRIGISDRLSIGTIATVSPIAMMIPPSVMFPIYGLVTEQSIGRLLIAGFFPGVVGALVLMILVFILCTIDPKLAPRMPPAPWSERFGSLKGLWGIGLVFAIVIGGIYSGIITANEAGAIGAIAAFAVALSVRRMSWKVFMASVRGTVDTTGTILIITVSALFFARIMSITKVGDVLMNFIIGTGVPPMGFIVMVMLLWIILGCIMSNLEIMLIIMPILYPIILEYGFDPIWFGVLVVFQGEMAAITPPFGMLLFAMSALVRDVNINFVIRSVVPFIIADFFILAIYVAFPQLSLWLPNAMMGGG